MIMPRHRTIQIFVFVTEEMETKINLASSDNFCFLVGSLFCFCFLLLFVCFLFVCLLFVWVLFLFSCCFVCYWWCWCWWCLLLLLLLFGGRGGGRLLRMESVHPFYRGRRIVCARRLLRTLQDSLHRKLIERSLFAARTRRSTNRATSLPP